MLHTALKLLEKIEEHGYKAYLVGGFVRDYLLGIESNDIDVTTNATPKDIKSIFKDACLPHEEYGSITVMVKSIRFEITTFRRELAYYNNRKPIEIEYIDNLLEDLRRRDFTINTFCMNQKGQILDFFHGQEDLDSRLIRTVGDSDNKFKEDSLRILRAVRFATTLNFQLTKEVRDAIINNKNLLKTLSYERKRQELDKIFTSKHVKEGISLLLELGLDEVLELPNLKKVSVYDDLIGIWTTLEVEDTYPFTNNEKELMKKIRDVLPLNNLDPNVLYKYGLYINSIAANQKGVDKKRVSEAYQSLPIHSRGDIVINGNDIIEATQKKPGPYLKEIYQELENKILNRELKNDKTILLNYCRLQIKGKN